MRLPRKVRNLSSSVKTTKCDIVFQLKNDFVSNCPEKCEIVLFFCRCSENSTIVLELSRIVWKLSSSGTETCELYFQLSMQKVMKLSRKERNCLQVVHNSAKFVFLRTRTSSERWKIRREWKINITRFIFCKVNPWNTQIKFPGSMVANPGLRLKENPQNPESCRNLGIFFRVRNFWFLSCILLSLLYIYCMLALPLRNIL